MGVVILICILLNRFLEKIPIPSLLIFIALGMFFGENGVLRIPFDNYEAVNIICSICLIFIMFYGGFGTNLHAARPVLTPSILMSTLGVVGTAGAVALFAHFALKLSWLECFLIGAVISSTDAASVFNILRSQKLALKYHTDSLLEVESGSNDPMSYMLTTVAIALLSGQSISVPLLLAQQIIIGILCGAAMGWLAVKLLHQNLLSSQQSHTIFLLAIMVLAYAIPSQLNGNGYLSVYLCGILIGNSNLPQKKYFVHFFDVLTHVAQVLIFFLLGLLVTPVNLPSRHCTRTHFDAVSHVGGKTSGECSAAGSISPQVAPNRTGILVRPSWCGFHRVCHWRSAERCRNDLQSLQPGILHGTAIHLNSRHSSSFSG